MIEIGIALISGIFALASIVLRSRRKIEELKTENTVQANELSFRTESLALKVNVADWSLITNSLTSLMADTCIDRFFILNAFNGYHDPRWTTAIYQVMQGDDKIESYVHFGIDSDYVSRLKEIRMHGYIKLSVKEIPNSILRSVYHTEGVLSSGWFFITEKVNLNGSVGITYCSFSSHTCDVISDEVMERCAILVNQIRGALARAGD